MGTIDSYGTIHINQRQTSKQKIINAIAQCEYTLISCIAQFSTRSIFTIRNKAFPLMMERTEVLSR